MGNSQKESQRSVSKSGVMPRPVLEPEIRRDPPPPSKLPESPDQDGATTGKIPYIAEGHDSSAAGDVDRVEHSQ